MAMPCVSAEDVEEAVNRLREIYPQDSIRVINRGSLLSALHAAQFHSNDNVLEASLIIYYVVTSHPLSDGNKRLSFILASLCLTRAGAIFDPWRIRDIVIDVARGAIDRDRVIESIRNLVSSLRQVPVTGRVSVDSIIDAYRDVLESLRLYDLTL